MPDSPAKTESRLERMAATDLPIMPRTAAELRRLLELDSTRHPNLQDVLIHDPAATIALFRRLQVVRPGACEQVAEIAHAVSMIGLDAVRELLEALVELPVLDPGTDPPASATMAYSQAAHAAQYATALGRRVGLASGQSLPTAALLQNPAMLALWAIEPESAQRATFAMRDGLPADSAFGAEIGMACGHVNRHLAEAWCLPRLARDAMQDSAAGPRNLRLVQLAGQMAESTASGWANRVSNPVAEALAEFLRLKPEKATAWLHELTSEAARQLDGFGYPLPGFEMVQLQEEEDDDAVMPEMRFFRAKQVAAPAPKPDLNGTMAELMRRIRHDTGAQRVIFAMLNADRTHLRTRLSLGGEAKDGLRRLNLPMARTNLFIALMSKPQSVWIRADNRARYRHYLTDGLASLFDGAGGYVMSIFVQGKPVGLVYADHGELSEDGYRRFRALCADVANTLLGGSRPPPAAGPETAAATAPAAG
jgi:HD-like signal output (HDOD) protein